MAVRLKKSRIAAIAVFILFLCLVLSVTDKIVRAKFIGDSTTIVNGFYAEKKNDIDLIVIGSSNSFCTINPIVLYEEYGIAAYDFGSSSQPMNISALYLKEALKRQKPKVVALEVNMMVGDSISSGNEAALRWGFTDIPLSADKLQCIYQSVGAVNADYFSYVFPIFRYHSRWKELSRTDYTYFWGEYPYIIKKGTRKNRVPQLVEKLCFCLRSRLFIINFSDDMCVGKITSIRTSVRIDGIAVNECMQGGCFGGKVPTGLFRRS